tara:strand:- start:207 stop:380 length:174 start_codon:yes stop_codon:yes gene_type:complete
MTITYQKVNDVEGEWQSITKKVDGNFVMSIPMVEDNADYQEYLEWAKIDGNSITAAD